MNIIARFLLFVSVLLITQFSVAENRLIISNGATKPPMHTDNFTGFIDIVLSEALNRIGYKLDIRGLPNERSLINANRGIIDGESNRIAGMEKNYPNLIRVPEKIIDWEFIVFSKKQVDTTKGWDSLTPYETSFITGWKIFEYNVPKDVMVTQVRNPEGLMTLLENNRADVALYERWQGLDLIRKNKYKNIKAMTPPLARKEMFIYLHNKHAALVPKLAQALKDMKKDGTYQRFYQQIIAPLEK